MPGRDGAVAGHGRSVCGGPDAPGVTSPDVRWRTQIRRPGGLHRVPAVASATAVRDLGRSSVEDMVEPFPDDARHLDDGGFHERIEVVARHVHNFDLTTWETAPSQGRCLSDQLVKAGPDEVDKLNRENGPESGGGQPSPDSDDRGFRERGIDHPSGKPATRSAVNPKTPLGVEATETTLSCPEE